MRWKMNPIKRVTLDWLGVDAVIIHPFIRSPLYPPRVVHHITYTIQSVAAIGTSTKVQSSEWPEQVITVLRINDGSNMSTQLLQHFPSLSGYPTSFLKDLLSSPQLVEAYLFTLPQIQELAAEVERLSKENEDLASRSRRYGEGDTRLTIQRVIWL